MNKEITTCLNCLYFDPVEDERGFVQIGLCKINAPDLRGFPRMRPQDGCGEGRLDENKIIENEQNYEVLNNEDYQEPSPYIRVNEMLNEQPEHEEQEEVTESDIDIINKILGEEPDPEVESQKKT